MPTDAGTNHCDSMDGTRASVHLTEQGDASAALRLWATAPPLRRGPLDFVVTFDQAGTGELQWLEYPNTGTRFAPVPLSWPIPLRAIRVFEQGDASAAFELHGATDLDGDRASDFVTTFENGTAAGMTEWRLYRGCVPQDVEAAFEERIEATRSSKSGSW